MSEVQRKYHEKDVKVARKDGLILIRETAAEVKNMMDIKMNAVLVSIFFPFRRTELITTGIFRKRKKNLPLPPTRVSRDCC
ncbi:UNVERIFIED_CONTAM: hypothetical protein PYX00_001000 [Menopon gallinae]|uniref:Uncharacterized protein n=1 Tax=Menopon gallinae TaxID=328185 RepID=A0AAW2IBC8_9NEOP